MNQQAFVFYLDTFDAAIRAFNGAKAAEAVTRVAKAGARDERALFGLYEKVRDAVDHIAAEHPTVVEPVLVAADKAFDEFFPLVRTPHAWPAMALSSLCEDARRPADAARWDRRVLEILGKLRHEQKQQMIASSRHTLAEHLFDAGSFDEAFTEAAAVLASGHADEQTRVGALQVQADSMRSLERFDEALELHRQVLVIYEDEIKPPQTVRIVATLLVMVTLYRERGEYSEAILLAERALKTAENGKMGVLAIGVICDNLGQLWQERAHFADAKKYLERALELYKEGEADEEDLQDVERRLSLLDTIIAADPEQQIPTSEENP